MSLPLVFHPGVQSELNEAYQWYERRRPGLGDDLLAAIEEVFGRLSETPRAHAKVHKDARRALPRRFPYAIIYRAENDRVEVIAVHHTRRNPSGWQERV